MRPGRMALMAIAVPIATKALRRVGQSMQSRQGGQSKMGGAMQKAGSGMEMFSGRGGQGQHSRSGW